MPARLSQRTINGVNYYHRERPCLHGGTLHQVWAFADGHLVFMDCWWG